jgi:hypothetical protein
MLVFRVASTFIFSSSEEKQNEISSCKQAYYQPFVNTSSVLMEDEICCFLLLLLFLFCRFSAVYVAFSGCRLFRMLISS